MKVVICGAGITGLTLANRLATLGAETVLLERAPGPREHGYMMDFFGPGYDAAEAMGILPDIEDVAYYFTEATFVDDHGRRRAGVRPSQFANGRVLSIMRPDLEQVLRERLPSDVDLRFGTGPATVDDRGDDVRVTLEDGSEIEADLLIGADGVHSTVRRLVFGEQSRFLRYLGMHTAAFTFESPEIHAATRDRACLTDTIDRQMGFYALRDGRVATFGVHRSTDPAPPDDSRTAVRDAYRGLGWKAPEALDRCPPSEEIFYDQVAQIIMPRWHAGRVALVGDACYAVSLLAGQGASLGMAGAYLLADRLVRANSVDQALAEYERLWRPVVEEKQRVGRSTARWFLPASRWQLWQRRTMLRLADLPVINRLVAGSLTGELTTLIRELARAGGSPSLPSSQRGTH